MKKIFKRVKKGFTLIEMVIVLFIISLLMVIILPNLGAQKTKAQNKTDLAFQTTLQSQVDMYEGTPTSFEDLKGSLTKDQLEKAENGKYKLKDGIVEYVPAQAH